MSGNGTPFKGRNRENWEELCATYGVDVNTYALVEPHIFDEVFKLARGTYQRNILLGRQAISGSTLRGEQKKWFSKYKASREALIGRLELHGFLVTEVTSPAARRVLLVSEGPLRKHWRKHGATEKEIPQIVKAHARLTQ